MDILYLSHKNPVSQNEGAKIVIMGTLKHLASKGCRITLVFLDSDGSPTEQLERYCAKVIPVSHRLPKPAEKALMLLGSLYSGEPYSVRMFKNKRMEEVLSGLAKNNRFDVAHIETALLYQYSGLLNSLPLVIRHHNLEASLLCQQAARESGLLKRFVLNWQAKRLSAFEAMAVNGAHMSVAMSEADRESIVREYGYKGLVDVIPSGMEVEDHVPEGAEHCLVFTGRVDWGPNLEGVIWFIEKVFPEVLKSFPGLKLYIAGGMPPKPLKALGSDSIIITGPVKDIKSYIDRAEVYIVPILTGSGIRLKILEAMSRGKAIVSTAKGAEGIVCENGGNIRIADRPAEFADAIIALLKNKKMRENLGRNAFENVKKNYSWESVAQRFISSYSLSMNSRERALQGR